MLTRKQIPLLVVVLLDVMLIGSIPMLRQQTADLYVAAIQFAYAVCVWLLAGIIPCVIGYLLNKGQWQSYLYPIHLIVSFGVFAAAEFGAFRFLF